MTTIIYHGGCPDGTAAAWCMSLHYNPATTYYHYGKFKETPPNIKDQHVIFVDFTYDLFTMMQICQQAKSVLVLDHHKSAECLAQITDVRFKMILDLTRSGAQIAWDYVSSVGINGLKTTLNDTYVEYDPIEEKFLNDELYKYVTENTRPWFINDIADRDLWAWQIPSSKDSTRAMQSFKYYESILNINQLLKTDRNELIKFGEILNSDDDNLLNLIVSTACLCTMTDGQTTYRVKVVECSYIHASEVGNRLVADETIDFAAMIRINLRHSSWNISLRAAKDIDLSQIVKKFDPSGGGHPKAAGMTWKGPIESLFKVI